MFALQYILYMSGGAILALILIGYAEQDDRLTWLRRFRLTFTGAPKLAEYLEKKYNSTPKE